MATDSVAEVAAISMAVGTASTDEETTDEETTEGVSVCGGSWTIMDTIATVDPTGTESLQATIRVLSSANV